MKDPRITILYLDHSNDFSGGQKSLLTLLSKLDRNKINPIVVLDKKATKMAALVSALNIKVVKINYFNRFLIEYIMVWLVTLRVRMLMSKLHCDLLHCNTFKAGIVGALCSFFTTTTPIIFRARLGIEILSHGVIDKIIHRYTDLILANSHYVKETFTSRFGANEKVKVVYNPVELNCKIDPAIVDRYRTRYFPHRDVVYFGVIGRIEPFKRLQEIVEATRKVSSTNSILIKILFIGEIPLGLGDSYKQELVKLIDTYELSDRFVFTGFVNHMNEISSLLDCVILCSQGEALSRGIYESQALGLPVIAAKSGGNMELIDDGVNGILYQPGDTDSLAAAMQQIAFHKDLRRAMGNEAHRKVSELFDDAKTVGQEIDCYYNLLNRSKIPRHALQQTTLL